MPQCDAHTIFARYLYDWFLPFKIVNANETKKIVNWRHNSQANITENFIANWNNPGQVKTFYGMILYIETAAMNKH